MPFFNLFIYFIVIANIIFFFKSIAWNLLSQIPYSVSMIPFPFPDSGFRVLVLPLVAYSIIFNIAIHLHVTHNQVIPSILP